MAQIPNGKPVQDRWLYVANRAKFKPQDLLPYAGQWIAWSLDGSRIVAHSDDLADLDHQVEQAGLTFEEVVIDSIPPGGVVETLL